MSAPSSLTGVAPQGLDGSMLPTPHSELEAAKKTAAHRAEWEKANSLGPWKEQWADADGEADPLDDFDEVLDKSGASDRRSQIDDLSDEQLYHLQNPYAKWRKLDAEGDGAVIQA